MADERKKCERGIYTGSFETDVTNERQIPCLGILMRLNCLGYHNVRRTIGPLSSLFLLLRKEENQPCVRARVVLGVDIPDNCASLYSGTFISIK